MRDEMKEAGLPEPIFSTDGVFFTVEFKRPKRYNSIDDTVNDTVNIEFGIVSLILNIIMKKEGLSAPQLSKIIGKSLITTKRYLAKLRFSGKIEFRGAAKNGGYYLK